ncbi:hypothetical protein AA106556_1883 [Neokomagataea tanensis NBRC 106556]|uniref:MobA-like NTP transferase domain-containing protein n=1 Tax=Neokomagataea tanensis NBRC 106556 TaxID=1223519 RepID=A0ABQ0QL46_9PROT|nr:hypothetical protein [Neokomagataea tanensis]GBR48773.1 hypothetical protein AA106556_1883 [Neokomagataea tanensis NBRC 106556]
MIDVSPIALILSGACVGTELAAEFGLVPPSFLPLGVGRIFDFQIDGLRKDLPDNIRLFITVPESFNIPPHDRQRLREKGVTPVPVPADLHLSEAIVYAINVIGAYACPVHILHGDTILGQIPTGTDIVAVRPGGDDYSWAAVHHEEGNVLRLETLAATDDKPADTPIACGYFAFSNGVELVRAFSQARSSFVEGVNRYLVQHPLRRVEVEEWFDFGHIQTYFGWPCCKV